MHSDLKKILTEMEITTGYKLFVSSSKSSDILFSFVVITHLR